MVDLDIGDLRIRDIGDTLSPGTFSSLTELSLSWNTVTSVRGLLALPRLKTLNLEGNRLGSGTPPLFSRAMPHFAASGACVGVNFSTVSGSSSPDAAATTTGAPVTTGAAWGGNERSRCDGRRLCIVRLYQIEDRFTAHVSMVVLLYCAFQCGAGRNTSGTLISMSTCQKRSSISLLQ